MVPEQTGEVEEGHGGTEEGRADGEPAAGRATSQDVLGERAGSWDLEETTSAEQYGREVVGNETPRCSSLRKNRDFSQLEARQGSRLPRVIEKDNRTIVGNVPCICLTRPVGGYAKVESDLLFYVHRLDRVTSRTLAV